MTNFIESIKEGFSVIKEELEELDRRTDFNRLFLDKMLNKMNLMDDNADILEYLDVDDNDDYYDDDREEHFGIVSLTLIFIFRVLSVFFTGILYLYLLIKKGDCELNFRHTHADAVGWCLIQDLFSNVYFSILLNYL